MLFVTVLVVVVVVGADVGITIPPFVAMTGGRKDALNPDYG